MAAALLGDEQASDLALHSGRNNDRTRLCQGLGPRRDVRYIAENLAARIEHHRAYVDGDPCGQSGLARAFVLAVQLASARWIASAARTARSASFSCAIG
jgi:hypothetical protein